jgi:hypothetical protein
VAPKTPVRSGLAILRAWWPLQNLNYSPEQDYDFGCHKLILVQILNFQGILVTEDKLERVTQKFRLMSRVVPMAARAFSA